MTRGANVRVFNNLPKGIRAPSRESAGARVRLKLYALAYVEARHGVDASAAMCWDALVLYCNAALMYVAALEGSREPSVLIDRTIQDDRGPGAVRTMAPGGDRAAQARTELKLAAMGYEATRRGADSYTQGGHAAIAIVCQAAIKYAEALSAGGGADKSHLYNNLGLEE